MNGSTRSPRPWCGLLVVHQSLRSRRQGSIGATPHALDVKKVGTGNLCPSDDTHDSLLWRIIHDGQLQKLVLHEKLQGMVDPVARMQRGHVATHQVRRND